MPLSGSTGIRQHLVCDDVAAFRPGILTNSESGYLGRSQPGGLRGESNTNRLIRRPEKGLVRGCFFVTSDTAELVFRDRAADGQTRAITPRNGPKSSELIHQRYGANLLCLS